MLSTNEFQQKQNIFTLKIFLSWCDFFPLIIFNENCTNYVGNTHYQIKSQNSQLYVLNCKFSLINNGAIRYESTQDSCLLVEHSSFTHCTSSANGGAIFFGTKGECILASVCGIDCNSTGANSYGQFCDIEVQASTMNKNQIFDSTISRTNSKESSAPIHQTSGNVAFYGNDISYNDASVMSAFYILFPSVSQITFSSFRNNTAHQRVCIDCLGGQYNMSFSDVVVNRQLTITYGLIYAVTSAKLLMIHCSILGNNPGPGSIFYVYDSSSSMTCDKCTFGPDQQINKGDISVNFGEPAQESFIN